MRRFRLFAGLTFAIFALPNLAAAQAPSPEVRSLQFYVGSWTASGEMRGDPSGPFEPVTGYENCSWVAGGYVVLCVEKVSGASGGYEGAYLLHYDAEGGRYEVYGVEAPGTTMHATGRLDGERWHWETDPAPDGSRLRYTFAPAEGSARTMSVEAGAGDEWVGVLNVTYTPGD